MYVCKLKSKKIKMEDNIEMYFILNNLLFFISATEEMKKEDTKVKSKSISL